MNVYYMPAIGPYRYDAIKKICGDRMPMGFDEWRRGQDRERNLHVANGDAVVAVGIDEVDFTNYCKRMNYEPDQELLAKLAVQLAGERKMSYPYAPTGTDPSRSRR